MQLLHSAATGQMASLARLMEWSRQNPDEESAPNKKQAPPEDPRGRPADVAQGVAAPPASSPTMAEIAEAEVNAAVVVQDVAPAPAPENPCSPYHSETGDFANAAPSNGGGVSDSTHSSAPVAEHSPLNETSTRPNPPEDKFIENYTAGSVLNQKEAKNTSAE